MSQTLELKDEVFTKLKQTADKNGVTPELWIEISIEEESKVLRLPKISVEERNKLDEFHKKTKTELGKMWKEKYRRQLKEIKNLDEQNTD